MIACFDRQARQAIVPESRAMNLYYVLPFQTPGYPQTKVSVYPRLEPHRLWVLRESRLIVDGADYMRIAV